MSNLLDKASIILTPTAYNNGEALCVKPSDGSGDFDFSRNSAATRVNAQGLVENVQILSSNLVQNGSFSEEGVQEISNGSFSQEGVELLSQPVNLVTDFNPNGGSTIIDADTFETFGGTLEGIANKSSSFSLIEGRSYKLVIEGDTTSDGFTIGNYSYGNEYGTGFGTHYFVASGTQATRLWIRQQTSGVTNITSFSVREVGQDWTLETGWSIGEDKAISDGSGSIPNTDLIQGNVFTSGKSYKVTLEIKDYVSGNLQLQNNTTNFPQSNGIHTIYSSTGSTSLILRSLSFIGSITNISVKEVGQNWDILNDVTSFSFDNGIANIQGTANSANNGIKQVSISSIIGKTYKISATLRSNDGGLYRFRLLDGSYFDLGSGNSAEFETITSYHTATSTAFTILATSWYTNGTANFDISNITIIEISTDTNLPRINYENFSYQDALGSEEIVNGGFDTDSDWLKGAGTTISGGAANLDGSLSSSFADALRQVSVFTVGKTYKVTYTISNYVSGANIIFGDGATEISANGTYTEYITATITNFGFQNRVTPITCSIDNVSVKEYLGQEVVPDSGCGSWLFEPQSTNLITYSEDFSDAYWAKSGSPIVTLNYGISPSGENKSVRIQGNNSTAIYHSGGFSATDGRSIYVKATSGSGNIQLLTHNGNTDNVFSIDENWQRVEINTSSSNPALFYAVDMRGSSTNIYDIQIWGAQVEQQSYATSYIPTSGATVTRNQDVCTNGGSLASINSTEGVLYAEIAALSNSGNNRIISLSNGSQAQRVIIFFSSTSNEVRAISANVSNQCDISFIAPNVLDYLKVAFKFKQNDFALWVNGTEVGTDTNGITSIGLNELAFDNGSSGANFFGKTKAVAVWKEALSDSELQSLTTI